jgi:hypothetical protein
MPNDHFDFTDTGPFFDYVGAFLAAVAGSAFVFNDGNPGKFTINQVVALQGLVVGSHNVYPLHIYENAAARKLTQSRFAQTSCMMLANSAYEAIADRHMKSPESEFLRHVRNASSHGNRFKFSATEPRGPAAWRNVVIDSTMKGSANPLSGKSCFGYIVGPADILMLLHDIEGQLLAHARATTQVPET